MIVDLLWVIFLVSFGACFGWTWRDYIAEKQAKAHHKAHMGLYSTPELAHWFRLRGNEIDPYWARMPLREYAKRKQEQLDNR